MASLSKISFELVELLDECLALVALADGQQAAVVEMRLDGLHVRPLLLHLLHQLLLGRCDLRQIDLFHQLLRSLQPLHRQLPLQVVSLRARLALQRFGLLFLVVGEEGEVVLVVLELAELVVDAGGRAQVLFGSDRKGVLVLRGLVGFVGLLCRESDALLVGRGVVVAGLVGLEAAHVEGGLLFGAFGSVELVILHDLFVAYRLLGHFLQPRADFVL